MLGGRVTQGSPVRQCGQESLARRSVAGFELPATSSSPFCLSILLKEEVSHLARLPNLSRISSAWPSGKSSSLLQAPGPRHLLATSALLCDGSRKVLPEN